MPSAGSRESGSNPSLDSGLVSSTGTGTTARRRRAQFVTFIGEAFHANFLPAEKLPLLDVDADHWKSWVHQRLATPVGSAGAMTLYAAQPQELKSL